MQQQTVLSGFGFSEVLLGPCGHATVSYAVPPGGLKVMCLYAFINIEEVFTALSFPQHYVICNSFIFAKQISLHFPENSSFKSSKKGTV